MAHRPEIWEMVLTPYLAASWDTAQRLRRIIDHCDTSHRLGPLFTAPWDGYVVLTSLPEIGPECRLTIDQPRWLLREGQSAISIWEGGDRLVSLSYCLSSHDGNIIVYVGGVQGRLGESMLGRYRQLTKSAHGMRPTDLLIEIFKVFCKSINAEKVLCVSDEIHQRQSDYYPRENREIRISRQFNTIWKERAAVRQADGFFLLSTKPLRRTGSDVPRNKRAMYRRRYSMLDGIEARIDEAVKRGLTPAQLLSFGEEADPWPRPSR